MGARRSAETVYALRLIASGATIAGAARVAGIYRSTLQRAIKADAKRGVSHRGKYKT